MKRIFLVLLFILSTKLFENSVTGLNSNCNCWENVVFRQACEWGGNLDEETCRMRHCCYDNSTNSLETQPRPFCYKRKGRCPKDDQCVIPGQFRKVCGHRALDRHLCQMRGCCFDDSQFPFCYYKKRDTEIYQRTLPETTTMTTLLTTRQTASTVSSTPFVTTTVETTTQITQPPITTTPTSTTFAPTTASTTTTTSTATTATAAATTTTTVPTTHNGGPFGFYLIGNMLIYLQCSNRSLGISCGRNITDKDSCHSHYCCWKGDSSNAIQDICILPSVYMIKWPPTEDNWSHWEAWSKCEGEDCSLGKQSRNRTCVASSNLLSARCVGNRTEERSCVVPCPAAWSSWDSWSPCPASCGPSITMRTRRCLGSGEVTNVINCPGRSASAFELSECNKDLCASWSTWEESPCSVSCGPGVRYRTRRCAGNATEISPTECNNDVIPCELTLCPPVVNEFQMNWAPWSEWSDCPATCGRRERARTRSCVDSQEGMVVTSDPGTAGCEGGVDGSRETEDCNADWCSSWSPWQVAIPCDNACGESLRLERRVCRNGSESNYPPECVARVGVCVLDPCV